ncbi:MAG TPA: P83/100 family protein [Spirochaetota bacterium]|nr:P83/100 family protein [Spirochaetota bacterium]
MKKILSVIFMMFSCFFTLFSLTVDEGEINLKDTNIEFINYRGTYRYTETLFEIKSIGTRLATGVKDDNNIFRYFMKYSIVHAIDNETSDLYDAAIFFIDSDAKVDHIRNVRAIISAYLEKKFGYSAKDSTTLATFVTIYNAVNKGNLDFFKSKYKPIVINNLNAENCGMSTKYFDWPGKTQIVIPLTDTAKKGNLSSLDTTELTDKKVIDELRKKDDKGIEERKDMTNLKEKEIVKKMDEIDKDSKKLEKEKETIKNEEKKVDDKKLEIEKKKEEITKKEDDLKKIVENTKNPTDEEKKVIEKKQNEIDKGKDDLKKEQDKLKEMENKLDEKKKEVKKLEDDITKKKDDIAKKEKEVSDDKKDIKKDQIDKNINEDTKKTKEELTKKSEELTKKEVELDKREQNLRDEKLDKTIFADKLYYLKIKEYMDGGHYNNEMYIIDPATKKIVASSDLKTICGHKYDIYKDGVVVIAHVGSHNSVHNLVLLNREDLKINSKGKEDIFWRSFVEIRSEEIYAVIKQDDKTYFLGKFNNKLELIKKTIEKVDPNTFISFYENFIYINGDDKSILVLDKNDLTLTDKIKP